MADLALAHQAGGVEDVVVRRKRDELRRHHVADANLVEVGPLGGEPEHVALREDPHKPLAVADGHRADVLLEHPGDRHPNRIFGRDLHDPEGHDVGDGHCSGV